jgi:hypothetical protein
MQSRSCRNAPVQSAYRTFTSLVGRHRSPSRHVRRYSIDPLYGSISRVCLQFSDVFVDFAHLGLFYLFLHLLDAQIASYDLFTCAFC